MKKKVLLTTAFVIILASTGQSKNLLCEYGMLDVLEHVRGGRSLLLIHTTQEDIAPSQRKVVSKHNKQLIKYVVKDEEDEKAKKLEGLYGTRMYLNNETIWKIKFAMLQSAMLAKIPVSIYSKGDCTEYEDKFLVTVCIDADTCY